ncbi:hypothetical protein SDC9_134443 [bioreactor metagenome]|uniref:Uncharacterized protein n=1 Tax=bioreactor metagenome TaxID=1076179 RepID=A0A645DDM3_9ZZZZ
MHGKGFRITCGIQFHQKPLSPFQNPGFPNRTVPDETQWEHRTGWLPVFSRVFPVLQSFLPSLSVFPSVGGYLPTSFQWSRILSGISWRFSLQRLPIREYYLLHHPSLPENRSPASDLLSHILPSLHQLPRFQIRRLLNPVYKS